MKYSEAKQGRIFILRLEDGDIIHYEIEKFAKEKNIFSASVSVVGGVDIGSILIVGPKESRSKNIIPMEYILQDTYEATGCGTIFPNKDGIPVVHIHISCGRETSSITGCIRKGVKVWHVLEVIINEITESTAKRLFDKETGFDLLRVF